MKIVKPIDVTDEVLIDSSISMPDVAMGEQEWQDESQRVSQSANVILQSPMVLIDSLYISDASGSLQQGLYILQGSPVDSYKLTHYDYELGTVIREVIVPTPTTGDGSHEAISLSFVDGNSVWVGRARRDPPEYNWHFDYVSYDLSDLSTEIKPARISNKYKELSTIYSIRFKTDGSNTVVTATTRLITTEGVIDSQETTLFNPSSIELSLTNRLYSDLCFVGDRVYGLANSPELANGRPITRVTVMDFNLSTINIFDFQRIEGNWVRPSINHAEGNLTHSLEYALRNVYARVYDKNMINIGSYKRDDEVIKSSTKRKYRCAVDATFDDPELGVNLSPPTWVDIGSVNRWMPFDKQPSQQAVSDNPMYYKLKPGEFVRALSIFNISSVSSVRVKVTDPVDGVIYDRDFDLVDNSNVVDMWTYLTLPISFKKELIITDLVCFRDSEIEITLSGERPAVGAIVTGNESPVGRCVKGTGVRSNQFSIRKENGFGGFDIIQRGVGKIARFRVAYDISQIDYITNLLESIDSQYCVFIGELPNNKVISIYGILDPYQSDFETPTVNTLEFDVLGVL